MSNPGKILFISDIHLEKNRPDITQQFLALLQNCDTSVHALYILGDLFEVWVGDDEDSLFHREVIAALREATQKGLPIFFLYGNRDFLIGKKFLQATGCQLMSDEEKIILYGEPVLLMHGDTLCTRDIAYLKARKKGRNPLLQTLFLLLPLKWRRAFADNMQMKSKLHKQVTQMEIMDVTQEDVVKTMQRHQVYWLIHGHTHRPAFHEFCMDGHLATRIVLAPWHEQGSVLIWHANGSKEMMTVNNYIKFNSGS